MNYPIASFLVQIKNAYMARKKSMVFAHSKIVESIGHILVKEGYLKAINVKDIDGRKTIEVTLLYHSHLPAFSDVKVISKPSIHRYTKKDEVKKSISRFKISILSTNQGIMTARDASKKNIGGELLCVVS